MILWRYTFFGLLMGTSVVMARWAMYGEPPVFRYEDGGYSISNVTPIILSALTGFLIAAAQLAYRGARRLLRRLTQTRQTD